jgi:hypothetical protein
MNQIDAKDEIAFIKKVIEDSKRTVGGGNLSSVIWGVIVVIGMILTYLHIVALHSLDPGLVWIILISLGWLYTAYSMIKQRKKPSTKTFGGRILSSVWIACGIALTSIGFYATSTGAIKTWAIIPLCCMIIGIGYYVTSDIVASRITKLIAIVWWIGGLLVMTWPGSYMFLLFAGMMIAFQIVPGIKYHLEWKQQLTGAAE